MDMNGLIAPSPTEWKHAMKIRFQFLSSDGVWRNTLGKTYDAENDTLGAALDRIERLERKHPHTEFRFVEAG